MTAVLPALPPFPSSAVGSTMSVVSALAFTYAVVAPKLRNFRQLQRDWSRAASSARATQDSMVAMQASFAQAQAQVESLKERMATEPHLAIAHLNQVRESIRKLGADIERFIMSLPHLVEQVRGLKKHGPMVTAVAPDFDRSLAAAEEVLAGGAFAQAEDFASSLPATLAALDEIVAPAVDEAVALVLEMSAARAALRTAPPTVDEAMKTIDEIGRFAVEHDVDLTK